MDNTKYLKELRKQNKLPELLRKLGLPHEEVKTENHECNAHFLPNSLTIVEWEKFPAYGAERTDFYELNDYMFLAGVKDHDQKRLQKLFNFMVENFGDDYRKAAKQFLEELRQARLEEVEAKVAAEKAKVNDEFDMRLEELRLTEQEEELDKRIDRLNYGANKLSEKNKE